MIKSISLRFLATTFLIGSSYASLIPSKDFGEMLEGDSREAIRKLYNAPMSTEDQAASISMIDAGKYFRAFESFVGRVIKEADEGDEDLINLLSGLGCYKFDGTAYKTIIDIALYNRYVDKLVQTDKFKEMVGKAREKRIAEDKISEFAEKVNVKNAKKGLKDFVHKYKEKENQKRELAAMASEEGLSRGVELDNKRKEMIEQKKAAGKEKRESRKTKPEATYNLSDLFPDEDKPVEAKPLKTEIVPPVVGPKKEENPVEIKPVVPTGENVPLVVEPKKEEKPVETNPVENGGTVSPNVGEGPNKTVVTNHIGFGANVSKVLRNSMESMIVGGSSANEKTQKFYVNAIVELNRENELFKKLNKNLSVDEFRKEVNNLPEDDFKKFISNNFYEKVKKELVKNLEVQGWIADDANKKLCELINNTPEDQVEDLLKDVHPDIKQGFDKKEGGVANFFKSAFGSNTTRLGKIADENKRNAVRSSMSKGKGELLKNNQSVIFESPVKGWGANF